MQKACGEREHSKSEVVEGSYIIYSRFRLMGERGFGQKA